MQSWRQMQAPAVYIFTLEELNFTMGHCQLSSYGEALYQHLLTHPRRTTHIKAAKLGVMPPFMAYEMHWPWYGQPGENVAVPGTDCYDATVPEARRLYEEYNAAHELQSGFFITLVDSDPDWFHEPGFICRSSFLMGQNKHAGNLLEATQRHKHATPYN